MVAAAPAAGTKMTTARGPSAARVGLAAEGLANSHSALSSLTGPAGFGWRAVEVLSPQGCSKKEEEKNMMHGD